MIVPLHPSTTRELGTHVLVLNAQPDNPRPFIVLDGRGDPLSCHRTLAAACARSRWHAGTRFVYVEQEASKYDCCWDGLAGCLVTWDQAFDRMGGTTSLQESLSHVTPRLLGRALETQSRGQPGGKTDF